MLGTGDVAIIYHISSTTGDGWLAGQSDTASKPRRQLSNPRDSAARPGGYCTRLHAIELILKMKPHSLGRWNSRCRCRRPAGLWRASRYGSRGDFWKATWSRSFDGLLRDGCRRLPTADQHVRTWEFHGESWQLATLKVPNNGEAVAR
jgi:hypothetical protein